MTENNNSIILSIHPEHAARIYKGAKRFELRKMLPKAPFSRVYLYENGSVGITGYFDVGNILHEDIDELWKEVGFEATSRERFFKYFSGKKKGYAIEVRNPVRFTSLISPTELKETCPTFVPPQGAMIMDQEHPLYELLDNKRKSSSSKNRQVSLRRIADDQRDLYRKEIKTYVGPNYEEIDSSFAEANLRTHDLGHDPTGFFTLRKEVLTILSKRNQPIGFTTLTYKRGGSVKTGPTILFKEYQNKGYGRATRTAIEDHVRSQKMRKVYCTAPQSSFEVIKYLLSSGYRVEAHLDRHYARDHGDIVFGKLIGPGVEQQKLRKPDSDRHGKLCKPDYFEKGELAKAIKSLFAKTWFKIDLEFAQKIVDDSLDDNASGYEEKPKWLACLSDGDICIGAAILLPKRGGAIKTLVVRGTSDRGSLKRLIKSAEELAKEQSRRKIYFLHPIADHEVIDLLIDGGYLPEGLLRAPYVDGRDVVVYSKFL